MSALDPVLPLNIKLRSKASMMDLSTAATGKGKQGGLRIHTGLYPEDLRDSTVFQAPHNTPSFDHTDFAAVEHMVVPAAAQPKSAAAGKGGFRGLLNRLRTRSTMNLRASAQEPPAAPWSPVPTLSPNPRVNDYAQSTWSSSSTSQVPTIALNTPQLGNTPRFGGLESPRIIYSQATVNDSGFFQVSADPFAIGKPSFDGELPTSPFSASSWACVSPTTASDNASGWGLAGRGTTPKLTKSKSRKELSAVVVDKRESSSPFEGMRSTPSMQDLKRSLGTLLRKDGTTGSKLKHSKTSPNLKEAAGAPGKPEKPSSSSSSSSRNLLRKSRSTKALATTPPPLPSSPPTPPPKDRPDLLHAISPMMPESCSFADLYAQLGIDPPTEEEDLLRTEAYFQPSGLEESSCSRSDALDGEQEGSDVGIGLGIVVAPSLIRPWKDLVPHRDSVDESSPGDCGTPAEGDVSKLISSYGVDWEQQVTPQKAVVASAVGHRSHTAPAGDSAAQGGGYAESQLVGRSDVPHVASSTSLATHRGRVAGRPDGSNSRSRTPSPTQGRAWVPPLEQPVRRRRTLEKESDASASEDDVPLARRLPGALSVQRSLRRGPNRYGDSNNTRRRVDGRENPKWKGEGGVPARQLEERLVAALQQATLSGIQDGSTVPAIFEKKSLERSTSLSRHQEGGGLRRAGSLKLPTQPGVSPMASRAVSRAQTMRRPHTSGAGAEAPPLPPVPSLTQHLTAASTSTSRKPSLGTPALQVPHASPNPPSEIWSRKPSMEPVISQRFFFESLQGPAVTLKIAQSATAEDVAKQLLHALGRPENLPGYALVEAFNEFYAATRPIRDFERVVPVMDGWNAEKRLNAMVYKATIDAGLCGAMRVSRTAPTHMALVQYETKPGKWSKRYLELHDGHVFIAKNDKGRESTFLCSSANFEVYKLGQGYKPPKGYNQVMMLKSQDKSSMFENLADYMHVFACDDITGPQLFTALFCARSTALLPDEPLPRIARPAASDPLLKVDIKPAQQQQRAHSPWTGGLLGRSK